DTATAAGVGIGYRMWSGRPGKSGGVYRDGNVLCAVSGSFAPAVPSPAAELPHILNDTKRLDTLDGNFGGACWDGSRLTILRDPFGVRTLYYTEHGGVFYFASELKQLLAIPGFTIEPDHAAIHKYLTFSFVPGEDVPVRGIKRVLPGRLAVWENGKLTVTPYFTLEEQIDPALGERRPAVKLIRTLCREAVAKRLNGATDVGLYLSGGLDSSGVAVWLKEAGVNVKAFTLDFGKHAVEKDQAKTVADKLGIPLTTVTVGGENIARILTDLVWKLDLPFGDPVTGPQYLLAKAAKAAGLSVAFNGEGGDQLFGGWTNKPMISAQLYAGLYGGDSREQLYLKSYHRFYGLEDKLYTRAFLDRVGPPGPRRALLAPYLHSHNASTFLNRIRLADISLKGSQNILPRMDRTNQCWGIDIRVPLFDRALAEASFTLPPQMKLHGACEKYVLKLALQKHLPREIVWRRKFGMSVPITEWALGPLSPVLRDLLNPAALARRGLFRPEYVTELQAGQDVPNEIRRRRIGERLWTLAMLEAWMRVFIDGKGRAPGGSA
ncbi:MAG TPA: asparagine synthase-related protein, partial [Gemmataceae bacterium]|nr:asparagine synthase-related protein [Gemmataceae bacterium]